MLVHLVDVSGASGRDPVEDFDTITEELKRFSPDVAAKPQIVAANKMDAVDDPERVKVLERPVKRRKRPFLKISGATGEGIDALLEALWKEIAADRGFRLQAEATKTEPDDESVDLLAAARRGARVRKA